MISSILIIAAAAGYSYYNYFYKNVEVEIYSLVPNNAIALFDIRNSIDNWNELQEKKLWTSLGAIPVLSEIDKTLIALDSITGKKGSLDKIFRNTPFCISIHQTSKESLGAVYYFKLLDLESYNTMDKVISNFKKSKNFKYDTRTYLDEKINEVKDISSKQIFSYLIYKDHFVGSYSPVLLEDVIRNIETETSNNFKQKNNVLFNLSGALKDGGSLYIDGSKIKSFLSIFSGENQSNPIVGNFSEGAKLNVALVDQEIIMSGTTLAGTNSTDYFLATFKGQKAGKIQMANLVPNRTSTLFHLKFDDGSLWYDNLISFFGKKAKTDFTNHSQIKAKFDLDPANFFKWMEGEIGLATLQSIDQKNPDKLLIIKANDIHEAYNQMNKLASKAESLSGDTLFKENFSDIDIRHLLVDEFPAQLLGESFKGFSGSYFSAIGNYIVVGNSIQVVKSLIVDMEADNVWGKSVTMNQYFDKAFGDANVSYILNTNKSWNSLIENVSGNWKQFLNKSGSAFKNFGMVSLQFSGSGENFFTHINIQHQEVLKKDREEQKFNFLAKIDVGAPIISSPFFVKVLGEKKVQIMLQDSLFNFYNISEDGQILWKDSIGEKIIGDISQIDYLKNGQLQYAFATPHSFHILTNDGSYINNNFPFSFEEEVAFMTVIDYDNSKNYRFLLATLSGNIFMVDKQMEALEGWNPRKMPSKPATAPQHLRVRGKDCLIALQENGEFSVMNRRGEMLPGFPVNLQGNFNNKLFFEQGPTLAQTAITTISAKGELVKMNLEGKILRREQLYRPSKETRFVLCIDEFKKTFVIARQELGILTILDPKGEIILEKDYITSGALEIQYFNTGIDREIYAVTDKIQEFTYLYDYKGNLINARPIDSSHPVALNFTEASGQYEVFASYEKQLFKVNFIR